MVHLGKVLQFPDKLLQVIEEFKEAPAVNQARTIWQSDCIPPTTLLPHKLQVEWHLAYHNETLRAAMHSQTRFANGQFLGMFLVSWEVGPRCFAFVLDWVHAHIHSTDCRQQHVFFLSFSVELHLSCSNNLHHVSTFNMSSRPKSYSWFRPCYCMCFQLFSSNSLFSLGVGMAQHWKLGLPWQGQLDRGAPASPWEMRGSRKWQARIGWSHQLHWSQGTSVCLNWSTYYFYIWGGPLLISWYWMILEPSKTFIIVQLVIHDARQAV